MNFWIKEDKEGIFIRIHVSPRSSKNAVVGIHNEAISIKITAPAVECKANKALEAFLAKLFQIKKNQVCITSGEKSREKTVYIQGVPRQKIEETLKENL